MFSATAKYYDLIHSYKDYAGEAKNIRAIIQREHPAARSILDVACGTGEHARLLSQRFAVDGIDMEPTFVALARSKVASGRFVVADMRRFNLGCKYDVVMCLFSSIGYLSRGAEVVEALQCFTNHLADGGVVIVEPWFTPDAWTIARPHLAPAVDFPDVKICGVNTSRSHENSSVINFHYLVGTGDRIEHLEENHVLALYGVDQMLAFFQGANLRATHDIIGLTGRGLYVARRS